MRSQFHFLWFLAGSKVQLVPGHVISVFKSHMGVSFEDPKAQCDCYPVDFTCFAHQKYEAWKLNIVLNTGQGFSALCVLLTLLSRAKH